MTKRLSQHEKARRKAMRKWDRLNLSQGHKIVITDPRYRDPIKANRPPIMDATYKYRNPILKNPVHMGTLDAIDTTKLTPKVYSELREKTINSSVSKIFARGEGLAFVPGAAGDSFTVDKLTRGINEIEDMLGTFDVSDEPTSLLEFANKKSEKTWQKLSKYKNVSNSFEATQAFYRIRAYALGGEYREYSGVKSGKYKTIKVESSIFKPSSDYLESSAFIEDFAETARRYGHSIQDTVKGIGVDEMIDSGNFFSATYKPKDSSLRAMLPEFELRAEEARVSGFLGRGGKSRGLYQSLRENNIQFLQNLPPEARAALEMEYAIRGQRLPITNKALTDVGAVNAEDVIEGFMGKGTPVTEGMASQIARSEILDLGDDAAKVLSSMSPEESVSEMASALVDEDAYLGETYDSILKRAGIKKKNAMLNAAEMMTMEQMGGYVKSPQAALKDIGHVIDYSIGMGQGSNKVSGNLSGKSLSEIEAFLNARPGEYIPSLRGGVAGVWSQVSSPGGKFDLTREGYAQKLRAVLSQYGVGENVISEKQITRMLSSTSNKELSKYTQGLVDKMKAASIKSAKKGTYARKGTSRRIKYINDMFKMQGSESRMLKGFTPMAFDIETTGLGSKFSFGPTKDYVTSMGVSKKGSGAYEYLINQFEGGMPSKALARRYYGATGASKVAKMLSGGAAVPISLERVAMEGLTPSQFSSRFIRETGIGKFGNKNILLGFGSDAFERKFLRTSLSKDYFNVKALDVSKMYKSYFDIAAGTTDSMTGLPGRKFLKLFDEFGFNKVYSQGNLAMNMGIMPKTAAAASKLHSAQIDAAVTRSLYERLLPSVRQVVESGAPGANMLSQFLPENFTKIQQSSMMAGRRLVDVLDEAGLKYADDPRYFEITYSKFQRSVVGRGKEGKALMMDLKSLDALAANIGKSKNAKEAAKIYSEAYRASMRPVRVGSKLRFSREIFADGLSASQAFAAQYGDKLSGRFGLDGTIGKEASADFASKLFSKARGNWKPIAIAAATIAAGAIMIDKWRSKPKEPIGYDPGEHSSASLFGGNGAEITPETMTGETSNPYNERVLPTAYTARIQDPTSVATNIRVSGKFKGDMDYSALAEAMGSVSSSMLGARNASSRVNVSDDRRKMNQRDISRRIARMV